MRVLSKAWRYGLAVISCGIALAVAIPLDSPSSCFFLAVMVSARRARRREQALFLRATASQEADINAGYDLTMADQYKPGDRVPRSGIYRVIHDPVHCQEHEVTCVHMKNSRRAMTAEAAFALNSQGAAAHIEGHKQFK